VGIEQGRTASRRDILIGLKQLMLSASALSLSPLCLGSNDIEVMQLKRLDTHTGLMLVQVCRLLFPHQGLSDQVYLDVVRDIESDMAADNRVDRLVKGAPEILHAKAGGNWMEAATEKQLESLSLLQGSELFGYLRNRTLESLYRNPVVWELVGYEGSSIEHGGYLNRGFDDIDWLD
jgi:hypothetical protein